MAANRAAVHAIQTFHCKMTSTFSPKALALGTPSSAELWRSGDMIRLRYTTAQGTFDYLQRDGRETTMTAEPGDGKPNIHGSISHIAPQRPLGTCDIWRIACLSFESGRTVPLADYLTPERKIRSAERDGNMLHVRYAHESHGDVDVWLDPAANYLVRRTVSNTVQNGTGLGGESAVEKFTEAAPGVFFPARVACRWTVNGKPSSETTYTFTEVKANHLVPADVFGIRFVHGMRMADYIQNKIYTVHADGKLLAPTDFKLRTPGKPPVQTGAAVAALVLPVGQPSESEAPSSARWVLTAAAAAFVAALVLWLVGRRAATA